MLCVYQCRDEFEHLDYILPSQGSQSRRVRGRGCKNGAVVYLGNRHVRVVKVDGMGTIGVSMPWSLSAASGYLEGRHTKVLTAARRDKHYWNWAGRSVEYLGKFSPRYQRDTGTISMRVVPTTPKDPAVIRARRKRTPNPGEIWAGCPEHPWQISGSSEGTHQDPWDVPSKFVQGKDVMSSIYFKFGNKMLAKKSQEQSG